MSKRPLKSSSRRDPLRFFKVILIGMGLGFVAVMIAPSSEPEKSVLENQPAQTRSETPEVAVNPPAPAVPVVGEGKKPNLNPASAPPLQEEKSAGEKASAQATAAQSAPEDNKPAPEQSKVPAKPEPIMAPAANVAFPKTFSTADMDAALQPLISFKIGDDDAASVKEAVAAAARENGGSVIEKIKDPAAKKFAEWNRLHRASADFNEVIAFGHAHPLFPEPAQDPGFEKRLFLADAPSGDVLKYYTNRMPYSGAGKASLGGALLESGQRERGLALIKLAWRRYIFDPNVEAKFLAKYGALLDKTDQAQRKLLLQAHAALKAEPNNATSAGTHEKGLRAIAHLRARKGKGALLHATSRSRRRAERRKGRQVNLIIPPSKEEAVLDGKAGAFRIVSFSHPVRLRKVSRKTKETDSAGHKGGGPAHGKQETAAKKDKPVKTLQAKAAEKAFALAKERTPGSASLLSKLKELRREGADDDVWSLLRSIDPNTADLADPDRWWEFRQSEIRRALNEDHPKTAYAIAIAHGPLDGKNLSEAQFLAGWIALRYLKDPKLAITHFEASRTEDFVRRDARAAYWLGRAALELGSHAQAQKYFAEAASSYFTFYGSLARQASRDKKCEFRAPPEPSKAAIAAFVKEDAFKAVIIAKQLDLQPILINYVLDLARQIRDPEQMTLVMELAERTVPVHVAVRAAKIAMLRGFATDDYAFPTLLPKFNGNGEANKVEPALLNALTRQESEFNTGSISNVGARGLMQIMPQTAKQVAASMKIKYEMGRLISDPSYNVTLGAAFLAQLISGYDGSYILSLAAYNAGPGRVSQWIKNFGDPRDKSIDPIDWVERIPIAETRHYVERILESTQLYRCRFEDGKANFQLAEDLHRGRPGKIPDLADVVGSGDLDQTP